MKFLHRIKAAMIRRRIVRLRVENIRAIRENRAAVFSLKAQLARELRLSGNLDRPQKIQKNTCRAFSKPNRVRIAEGKTLPRVSALIEKLPVPERRAA